MLSIAIGNAWKGLPSIVERVLSHPIAVPVASYPVSFEVAGGPNELVAFIRPISPSTSESIGCWLVVVVGVRGKSEEKF